jgi:hypothetical protein
MLSIFIMSFKSLMTDIHHLQLLLFGLHRLYEGHLQMLLVIFCPSQWHFSKIHLLSYLQKPLFTYDTVPPS